MLVPATMQDWTKKNAPSKPCEWRKDVVPPQPEMTAGELEAYMRATFDLD